MLRPPFRGSVRWFFSVAIWKREKVVVTLATIVWVTNTSFLVLGKSPSTPLAEELGQNHKLLPRFR